MYTDLFLVALISIFAISGFFQGFIRQLISILAVLAILFLAYPIAHWLKDHSAWNWVQEAPVMILWGMTCLMILLISFVIRFAVSRWNAYQFARPVDRWLGVSLGSLKGLVIALALSMIAHVIPPDFRTHFEEINEDWDDSLFVSTAERIFEWDFFSSIRSLRKIRNNLQESLMFSTQEEGPWTQPFGVDKK